MPAHIRQYRAAPRHLTPIADCCGDPLVDFVGDPGYGRDAEVNVMGKLVELLKRPDMLPGERNAGTAKVAKTINAHGITPRSLNEPEGLLHSLIPPINSLSYAQNA
jgi:hypothetical protein